MQAITKCSYCKWQIYKRWKITRSGLDNSLCQDGEVASPFDKKGLILSENIVGLTVYVREKLLYLVYNIWIQLTSITVPAYKKCFLVVSKMSWVVGGRGQRPLPSWGVGGAWNPENFESFCFKWWYPVHLMVKIFVLVSIHWRKLFPFSSLFFAWSVKW